MVEISFNNINTSLHKRFNMNLLKFAKLACFLCEPVLYLINKFSKFTCINTVLLILKKIYNHGSSDIIK